ncbi:hypothetical protein [Lactococcus lactis]|uniref:Phage protein n=1 Tax=Lactococcus lactis subsp. lactis A12 TaxID=1137134 RepID=S6F4V4_LACLL|nr:hypothetical protein [Lactococcus lactis]CDG03859.1 putative phage protein [Lactococcus lactis subsp. lactis A12]SBW30090.1 putative phage protein [Lactococcus lactis subsp. lactis]
MKITKYIKNNNVKIVVLLTIITLIISIAYAFNYSSNKKINDKKESIKTEIYLNKLDELKDENDRILELYRVIDGISEYEYETYEERELKNLKDWQKDNNMTDEEYNDMKDFVELNTKTYSDVYFNQPTRNNY